MKIRIDERALRAVIKRALRESSEPINMVDRLVERASSSIQERIYQLQDKLNKIEGLKEAVAGMDASLRSLPNIRKPYIHTNSSFIYEFTPAIPYNSETDSYEGIEGDVDDFLYDLIPEEYRDTIELTPGYDDYYGLESITLDISLDMDD